MRPDWYDKVSNWRKADPESRFVFGVTDTRYYFTLPHSGHRIDVRTLSQMAVTVFREADKLAEEERDAQRAGDNEKAAFLRNARHLLEAQALEAVQAETAHVT